MHGSEAMVGDDHNAVIESLQYVLGNMKRLGLLLRCASWNMTGPDGDVIEMRLHEQFREVDAAMDAIAQRIRILNGRPIPDDADAVVGPRPIDVIGPDVRSALSRIMDGHARMIDCLKAATDVAEAMDDRPTAAILIQRMATHQQQAWVVDRLLAGMMSCDAARNGQRRGNSQ